MHIDGIISIIYYLIFPLTTWNYIYIYIYNFKINLEKKIQFQLFIPLNTKILKNDII
jgi:hypothetical protein